MPGEGFAYLCLPMFLGIYYLDTVCIFVGRRTCPGGPDREAAAAFSPPDRDQKFGR